MVFPDVSLPRLARTHAPDSVDQASSSAAGASQALAVSGGQQAGSGGNGDGVVLRSDAVDGEKEAAAAEAELLDTLVGMVFWTGGATRDKRVSYCSHWRQ